MARPWVVDASVAAKWFLKDSLEDHVDLAEEVLVELLAGEIYLHAPRLMSYEVCRLLWKACMAQGADEGSKRLDQETASDCVETLFDLPLTFAEASAEEATESVDRGLRYQKNFYDMTYLRLAEALGCRVVTADEKLLRSAPPDFPRARFVLLTEYRMARAKEQAAEKKARKEGAKSAETTRSSARAGSSSKRSTGSG